MSSANMKVLHEKYNCNDILSYFSFKNQTFNSIEKMCNKVKVKTQ